jgi:hypothetical protein
MRPLLVLALLVPTLYAAAAQGARAYLQAVVAEPYLELHTGPGRGYPVFHVVGRGATIEILKRRTDWFKVRTEDRREGWVDRGQMLKTLQPSGEATTFKDGSREEFTQHHWEAGALAGDFSGARVITVYSGYAFNESLAVELAASHVLGRFSNDYLETAALTHVFVPEWRFSPFVTIGTGAIQVRPKGTLVQTTDRGEQVAFVGAGLRAYLTRRFMFRLEYKNIVAFTKRNQNEEISAWQGGFAFFF